MIVDEFSGQIPRPAVLDTMVAYIEDIDFLPNPRISIGGKLAAGASESKTARRGAVQKPFHACRRSSAARSITAPSAAFDR